MKIIENTTPEEGFVYEHGDGKLEVFDALKCAGIPMAHACYLDRLDKCKLVGKLNHTHEIKDGRLIEIKRDDVCVDDVFYNKNLKEYMLITERQDFINYIEFRENGYFDYHTEINIDEPKDCDFKRIGSLLWSHRIVGG